MARDTKACAIRPRKRKLDGRHFFAARPKPCPDEGRDDGTIAGVTAIQVTKILNVDLGVAGFLLGGS